MENRKSVDVIIIGFNEEKQIAKCLISVVNAIEILKSKTEYLTSVIYVDSHSTDNTVKIAEELGINVILAPTDYHTAANGRNCGLSHTKGTYVMFLDADMEIYPDWLVEGLHFLNTNPDAAGVGGIRNDRRLVGKNVKNINNYYSIKKEIELARGRIGGAFLFRRNALETVGGFESVLPVNEEVYLYCKLKEINLELYRIAHPMAIHWDCKINNRKEILKKFFFNKNLMISGLLLRKSIKSKSRFTILIFYYKEIIYYLLFIVLLLLFNSICFLKPDEKFNYANILLIFSYICFEIYLKKSPLRGFAAIMLNGLYLTYMLIGFVFEIPKVNFVRKKER
ncbi:MAG: glycosyltransferase family 2 protein [Candidatus Thermoplasmatota archaeon]|nr:glycosyltransferase family 2 protein [Candidatus Thermoplasmatota archaeon]